MEYVKEEFQTKPEIKEEYILPLTESVVGSENTTTIKNENEAFVEGIVNAAEEEKHPVKFDPEDKPNILKSLVESVSTGSIGVKIDQKNLGIKGGSARKGKIQVKNHEDQSVVCDAEILKTAHSEEAIEDVFSESYESDDPKGDFRDFSSFQNIPDKPSSSLQSGSIQAKKAYVKERKYACRYCNKRFQETGILKNHMRTHTGEKPFKCSLCCRRFTSKSHLKLHSLNHTGKPFCCSICSKRFLQSRYLKIHMLIHEDKRPFICGQCPMAFRQKSGLTRHIRRKHLETQEMPLDGEILSPNQSHLPQQIGNSGLNERFHCSDCGKTFKHKTSIILHMTNHHNTEQKPRYRCRICGITTSTSIYYWKKHEQLHQNIYAFKCTHCNMSFKQKLTLISHLIQTHQSVDADKYECVDCGRSFKTKANLTSHIEVYHSNTEKKFSCHICNMEFKRQCYLKRHVKTHTDADKTFVCNDCGLRCRSKTDIAKHVLTHLGAVPKSHVCEICGAGFSKRSHVVRHMGVHSDERPFPCDLCDKAYKDKPSLKIHHETVHCGASFICKDCGFSSTNRQSFTRHTRKCQLSSGEKYVCRNRSRNTKDKHK